MESHLSQEATLSISNNVLSRTGISISWTLLGYTAMLICAVSVGGYWYRDFYVISTLFFCALNFLGFITGIDYKSDLSDEENQEVRAWFWRTAKCLTVVAFYLTVLLVCKPFIVANFR